MIVASEKLCHQLFALSSWEDTSHAYGDWKRFGVVFDSGVYSRHEMEEADGYAIREHAPAYDLGFILQAIVDHSSLEPAGVLRMLADYITEGESFADAACRMAIHLFEDGILEKAA